MNNDNYRGANSEISPKALNLQESMKCPPFTKEGVGMNLVNAKNYSHQLWCLGGHENASSSN